MEVDPLRWPRTAVFLWALEHEQFALQSRQFIVAYTFGGMMDRRERLLMTPVEGVPNLERRA